MYPHERSLVEKLKEKPFVILGVNSDVDRENIKARIKEENITWRSWYDGGGTSGPIATNWNVSGWPTLYVIGADGKIAFKSIGFDEKGVDGTIEKLLAELEAPKP